jgi:hypothetical protein
MATGICIYCGRTLDSSALLDKAGKQRCKDEQDCLDYQTREDDPVSLDDPDYLANMVKSSLSAAAERIAAYGTAEGKAEPPPESAEGFAWMKAVLDALAAEYKERGQFAFHHAESRNAEYGISFHEADGGRSFEVTIGNPTGSRYTLAVAREEGAAGTDGLYREFIYKTYPGGEREDVIKDLSVILLAFAGEAALQSALLSAFRREIESRCYPDEAR